MADHPDHPVLPEAHTYKLVEFLHHGFSWTPEDHYIVLRLANERETVSLRFDGPRQLEINEYFPTQIGLFILDVSADGLEDLSVEVGDFEDSSIHFFARSVARL